MCEFCEYKIPFKKEKFSLYIDNYLESPCLRICPNTDIFKEVICSNRSTKTGIVYAALNTIIKINFCPFCGRFLKPYSILKKDKCTYCTRESSLDKCTSINNQSQELFKIYSYIYITDGNILHESRSNNFNNKILLFSLTNSNLKYFSNNENFKISYCPICGKKLTEFTWTF